MTTSSGQKEMRDFMLVLRRALLMLVRYIDKKYALGHNESNITE